MIKNYNNDQERINAMRQAIALREKWWNAVQKGMNREQMEKIGLRAPRIIA